MMLMLITLVVGVILSAWVILDALRPKSDTGSFAQPRRKEPNRVWDTMHSERTTNRHNPVQPIQRGQSSDTKHE